MLIFLSAWRAGQRPERRDSAALAPRLHLAGPGDRPDSSVAAPLRLDDTPAFVAGEGARIYSLAAFRPSPSGPHLPAA
jgi:hypothetical protein